MSFSAMLLFSAIVSLDGFLAGTAYGISKITVPRGSLFVIGAISFICTALALYLAAAAAAILPVKYIGATLLIIIGCAGILLKQTNPNTASIKPRHITLAIGRTVISIIRRPERADLDRSSELSAAEAALLGMALGLDNTAAAFAASLHTPLPLYTPLVIFIMQILFICGGMKLGRLISPSQQARLSYLPSVYFIVLGCLNLLL